MLKNISKGIRNTKSLIDTWAKDSFTPCPNKHLGKCLA